MNSLCTINSQLINLPNSELKPPSNLITKSTLNIPLDNDLDLVLHYPFNSNTYNYGCSTSLNTNRGPYIGVDDNTIIGSSDISFINTTISIFNSGTSGTSDFSGNIPFPLLVDPSLLYLYTFEPMDVSGSDASGGRYLENQANGNYDLLIDPDVSVDGTLNSSLNGSIIQNSFYLNSTYSIGCWFNTQNNNTNASIINLENDNTDTTNIKFFISVGNVYVRDRTASNNNGGNNLIQAISIDIWYHMVYVNSGSTWYVYVNGVLIKTLTGKVATYSLQRIYNTIGRNYSTTQKFNGQIDNFFIYNSTLTSTQVADIYSKGQAPTPTNYYYTVPIQYYQYQNPYLSINTIPANTNGYTFSYWIRLKSTSGVVFSFANALSTDSNRIYNEISGNKTIFSCDTSNILVTTTNTSNTWYHLAWTLNTTNQSNIYVNGNLVISNNTTIPYKSFISNYNWIMSDTYYSTSNSNGMLGYMNDFRYYNRVLDSAEVKQLSNIYDLSKNAFTIPFKLNTDPSLCLYYTFDTSTNSVTNYSQSVYGTVDASYVTGSYVNYTDISYIGTGGLKLKDTNSGYVKFNSNNIVTQSSFLSVINSIMSGGISFSCWFSSFNSGSRATIFDFAEALDICENVIKLSIINNNLSCLVYRPNGTANSSMTTVSKDYNDGVLRHVVWTLSFPTTGGLADKTSVWNLYVDNSNVISNTLNFFAGTSDRSSCFLGKSNLYSIDPSFNGYIDDFRIYRRILNATDISSIYYYKFNTTNTLVTQSSFLSWTRPIRYPNGSFNYYNIDNSLNLIDISTNINANNTTVTDLIYGNGVTFFVNSQIGNRQTIYISG